MHGIALSPVPALHCARSSRRLQSHQDARSLGCGVQSLVRVWPLFRDGPRVLSSQEGIRCPIVPAAQGSPLEPEFEMVPFGLRTCGSPAGWRTACRTLTITNAPVALRRSLPHQNNLRDHKAVYALERAIERAVEPGKLPGRAPPGAETHLSVWYPGNAGRLPRLRLRSYAVGGQTAARWLPATPSWPAPVWW
jgi:hypothetical protein